MKLQVKGLLGVESPKEGNAFQTTPSLRMKGCGICGGGRGCWQKPFSSYQRGRLKEDRLELTEMLDSAEVSEHANSRSVRADTGKR